MIRIIILLLAAFGAYTLYKTYVETGPNGPIAFEIPSRTTTAAASQRRAP